MKRKKKKKKKKEDDQSNAIYYQGRKVEIVMNNKIEMREKVEMIANRLYFKQKIKKIK